MIAVIVVIATFATLLPGLWPNQLHRQYSPNWDKIDHQSGHFVLFDSPNSSKACILYAPSEEHECCAPACMEKWSTEPVPWAAVYALFQTSLLDAKLAPTSTGAEAIASR
ncbi:unnamed protein product [Protopolystoma xenopodis]|uniref:Uncharacterized protein n=1 Tax=Protopolystoma xenopodis TaxID=117903 RepID=A0A3S5AXM9_9PLAT|nr:unnamed protein product [Protopolystoma xenopodis]